MNASFPPPASSDLNEIKARCRDRIEELATLLMGPPNPDTARRAEWRWGRKGSASVIVRSIRGKPRGTFYTHEGQIGGTPIDLVMHARGCGLASAIKWARAWVGMGADDYRPSAEDLAAQAARQAEREQARAAEEAEAKASEARRIVAARRIAAATVRVDGTVAERYLVETRKIPRPPSGWPFCVRFHASERALVMLATDDAKAVQAVQFVYLTPEATKIGAEEAERRGKPGAKQSRGVLTGAAVRLPAMGDASGPLLLAEGPESGLSAWVASGHEVHIILGGLREVALPPDRRVVFCRDDDPRYSPAANNLDRRMGEWKRAGVDVVTATPWPVRRYDKSDANDALQAGGVAAVAARIAAAIRPEAPATIRPRVTLAEARTKLGVVFAEFFTEALAYQPADKTPPAESASPADAAIGISGIDSFLDDMFGGGFPPRDKAIVFDAPPPVRAVRVDVGGGKSHEARVGAAWTLTELRKRGDDRCVVLAVPTHALGEEQATAFEALPLARAGKFKARVWRGREADDPRNPGQPMCLDLDAVDDAREAALPIQRSVCRKRDRENGTWIECAFFRNRAPSELFPNGVRGCGYQHQAAAEADLWIVPHELIYSAKPLAFGDVAALVVDEAAWQDGLEGHDGRPIKLSLDSLIPDQLGTTISAEELAYARGVVLDEFRRLPDGPVPRKAMLSADLDEARALACRGIEYARMVAPDMYPSMPLKQRKEAARAAAGNRTILRLAKLWSALAALLEDSGPLLSGWLTLATEETPEGLVRVLHMASRKPIRKGWLVPTLVIDATLDMHLVRPFWPHAEMVADIAIEAPYQRIFQVTDRAFALSMLEQLPTEAEAAAQQAAEAETGDDAEAGTPKRRGRPPKKVRTVAPEEAQRRARRLREVHAFICSIARRYAPRRVLVVAQIAVELALRDNFRTPGNVDFAHHNNVAGRDEWGPGPGREGVAAQIIIGRTLPGPAAVERIAAALTGSAIPPLETWYERAVTVREIAAPGQPSHFVQAEADRHPDPVAEAVRWQVAEGQIVQIQGRPRGALRTEANPVDCFTLTDAPLPLPIAGTIQASDLTPSPADLMLAAGGVAFENPTDAADAYPALWSNRNAAKSALQRAAEAGGWVHSPIKNLYIGECTQPPRADYQRKGPGKSPSVAWCDPDWTADPEAAIAALLGPLAWIKFVAPPAEVSAPEPVAPEAAAEPPLPMTPDEAPMPETPATTQTGLDPAALYPAREMVTPLSGIWTIRGQDTVEAVYAYQRRPPDPKVAGGLAALMDGPLPWMWSGTVQEMAAARRGL